MIPLRLAAEGHFAGETVVARLVSNKREDATSTLGRDYQFISQEGDWAHYSRLGHSIRLRADPDDMDGDVIMLPPNGSSAHRLIRANSEHNTLLITEQCDQLCVMCSQPPKAKHTDLFPVLMLACVMAPQGAVIGISGGEPLLYKDQLFALLMQVRVQRPDITFHVLTNGQHFGVDDLDVLRSPGLANVFWAIPIYSSESKIHDRIVGKSGAFERLLETFILLAHTPAQIEVRTVVMQSNHEHLVPLADFLTTYVPFASQWSIMQMERIGFGRKNWEKEFFDTSIDFSSVARALRVSHGRGLDARLYNFPLCTVPDSYQQYSVPSISDWKQKFLDFCKDCKLKRKCGGFFEWYECSSGFERVGCHNNG